MMLFGQKIHPLNFNYAARTAVKDGGIEVSGGGCKARITCADIAPGCTRLRFDNAAVADKRNYSDGVIEALRAGKKVAARAKPAGFAARDCAIEVTASGFKARFAGGGTLETEKEGFGFVGERMILHFKTPEAGGFYGFGERTKGFNKNGDSMEFYNVDVCAVFPHTFHRDDYDPGYVSIPLAVIKTNDVYTGVYIDNPGRMVFDAGTVAPGHLVCQSLGGNNDVYLIHGPSLREVVRHFTALTGRAEVPPLWSMGHHQCRWGYKTEAEFRSLKEKFREHDLPVSALWYDIDYMDEYRVFTWDKADIPRPAKLNKELKRAGIRSVAIIDPGVKLEPGYAVYESGKKQDVYCKTPGGRDYVGRVWPGDTVFPDFSREEARKWWAAHLGRFVKESNLDGAWLDMNDPSTGWSSAAEMTFENGAAPHDRYHNQYGHFMAKASREAMLASDPGARPFLLTRSGFTGTQRYSAIWTGDNSSTWDHLRMSIPCTMNLGLSGVAFNGPDVGGFLGHTEEELITRWYQACFLFPFFRNHSTNHTKEQEPWSFGPQCLARIRDAIYTRYRLMPYLYNCFFEHYLTGDPVLRPLLYEFEGRAFENMDDQFMVGGSILLAPILTNGTGHKSVVSHGVVRRHRHVTLPPGWWFDISKHEWIEGDRTISCEAGLDEVPIFIRDGSIIPWHNGNFHNSDMPLSAVELHIFLRECAGQYDYFIDDRETRNYLDGAYSTARIRAEITGRQALVRITEKGSYDRETVAFTPVIYGSDVNRVLTEHNGVRKSRALKPSGRRWVGFEVPVRA